MLVLLEFSNSLIRNFTFSLPSGVDVTKTNMEMTNQPAPYKLIVSPRQNPV